ncbi:MAG: aldo/keto reductase [Betaproteobacteria bacterium]|nr:aldo/keto reductase [Betaproteobacteria bacterium]
MDRRRRELLGAVAGLAVTRVAWAGERMRTRAIPSSGEALPVIGLGTWQTFDVGGGAAARAPLRKVLKAFFDGGGRVVDSSPMYGSSESVVGELCTDLGICEPLFLATKVWTRGREQGIREMQRSIERMRAGRMDLMQVHNLLDVEAHTKTLLEWKAAKRVRYIGVTHYASSGHAAMERALQAKQYDFVQINYSLDEPEAERRLLPLARELGVAVLVNRPFASGGMFRRVRGKPLPPWAAELGIQSWAQYFLKWIVAHPAISCVIPATANPEHVRDNLGAGLGALPDEAQRAHMAQAYDAI